MNGKTYLERFFEEKEIPWVTWELFSKDGTWHMIDTEVVKDFLINSLDPENQHKVMITLTKIDFHNGDVIPFLKYVAQGIVENF